MRWLNAREWLEHERLTGLPTADLAGEALGMLDELAGYQEDDSDTAADELQDVNGALSDLPGDSAVERAEFAVKQLDEIVDLHGGDYGTIVERTEAADLRWWAVWDVLVDAGVVERNQSAADVDVPALLRMFLPADNS